MAFHVYGLQDTRSRSDSETLLDRISVQLVVLQLALISVSRQPQFQASIFILKPIALFSDSLYAFHMCVIDILAWQPRAEVSHVAECSSLPSYSVAPETGNNVRLARGTGNKGMSQIGGWE